jgi:hypothetical protein
MKLDKAIVRTKELSESQSVCKDCREEYKQLAEWLEELKQYENKECEISAREMFEELGFRKCDGVYREGETLLYEKTICDGRDVLYVRFLHGMVRVTELANYVYNIDGKLMKAIYKQMEELGWLDSERKAIYHLTKFEYDLLNDDKEIHEWYFKCFDHLMRLKKQGHFRDVNIEKQIGEILLNCEVREDENC